MRKNQKNNTSEKQKSDHLTITNVSAPRSIDIGKRKKQYLISQLFRLACIILIVIVDNWFFRTLLALAAVLLPWIAVLRANDDRETNNAPDYLSDKLPAGKINSTLPTADSSCPSSAAAAGTDIMVLKVTDESGESVDVNAEIFASEHKEPLTAEENKND